MNKSHKIAAFRLIVAGVMTLAFLWSTSKLFTLPASALAGSPPLSIDAAWNAENEQGLPSALTLNPPCGTGMASQAPGGATSSLTITGFQGCASADNLIALIASY